MYTPYDLATAILDSNKTAGAVKVIEIKHAIFNIKGANNIIIRNLKFDEMWEWDEDSKGNHPRSRALWA